MIRKVSLFVLLATIKSSNAVLVTKFSVPPEIELVRNTLIGTIPTLCNEYSVSFDVNPTSFTAGYRSILHLSIGGNGAKPGDRVPGVWFRPIGPSAKSYGLHICGPVVKLANWCYNSEALPLNKWISVKVKQVKIGVDYFYSIEINGKGVKKIMNTSPAVFTNVKVYAADPWYQAQTGSIRNLNVDGKCDYSTNKNDLLMPAEIGLVKNTLIETIPILRKQYSVSFDAKPTGFTAGYRSILHLSIGGNGAKPGDRVPGVWFRQISPSSKTHGLHICGPVLKLANWCYNSEALPLHKWISIKVKQVKVGVHYFYSIEINGKGVKRVQNTSPAVFTNVKVYAADPWYQAQAGSIRNIVIKSSE